MIELTLTISDFDYSSTLEEFMPSVIQALQSSGDLNPLLRLACNSPEASAKVVKGLLAAMPKRQKEQLAVKLINANSAVITEKLNEVARDNNVSVKVETSRAASY